MPDKLPERLWGTTWDLDFFCPLVVNSKIACPAPKQFVSAFRVVVVTPAIVQDMLAFGFSLTFWLEIIKLYIIFPHTNISYARFVWVKSMAHATGIGYKTGYGLVVPRFFWRPTFIGQ